MHEWQRVCYSFRRRADISVEMLLGALTSVALAHGADRHWQRSIDSTFDPKRRELYQMSINHSPVSRCLRGVLAVGMVAAMGLTTGCGYFLNVRDDFADIGTFAIGAVTPVACENYRAKARGPIPPTGGIYLQASDFAHLGLLGKLTTDLEWDRRACGVMADARRKIGLGPFHHVAIWQEPIYPSIYKIPHNEMEGWHRHMRELGAPFCHIPAKTMIFDPEPQHCYVPWRFEPVWSYRALPFFPCGWQDWECISAEIAIPEPFILHTGFYLRLGIDPSQIFDFALSLICLDLYQDAAYDLCGNLLY